MSLDRRAFLAGAPLALAGLAAPPPAAAHVRPGERKSTPGVPFKVGIAAYSYRQLLQGAGKSMTLFDFIRRSAELGAEGVELTEYYFEKPVTHEYLLKLKREAHLWGQEIIGTPIGNSFTQPAGPMRDQQIETYKKWVDVSAVLGSPAIRTFAGAAPRGVPEADARRNVVECLNVVCEYAGNKGVFVALENHGGVVAEPDGLLEIVKAVDSPWLGVNLDSGNFRTADPYADLARVAPYAVTCQFKVEMFPKGQGAQPADFDRILAILRQAGYRGFVALEYEAREDPAAAVPRYVAEMRRKVQAEAASSAARA